MLIGSNVNRRSAARKVDTKVANLLLKVAQKVATFKTGLKPKSRPNGDKSPNRAALKNDLTNFIRIFKGEGSQNVQFNLSTDTVK